MLKFNPLVKSGASQLVARRWASEMPPFLPKKYAFDWDYPKLKPVNYQLRDPYKKYDDQQLRRNFDEPLHPSYDLLDMWAPDYFYFIDDKTAARWMFTFFGILAAGGSFIYYFDLYPERPCYPRTYPYDGLSKDLGASSEEDAHLYRARIDKTA